jgi:hypothetical protein
MASKIKNIKGLSCTHQTIFLCSKCQPQAIWTSFYGCLNQKSGILFNLLIARSMLPLEKFMVLHYSKVRPRSKYGKGILFRID